MYVAFAFRPRYFPPILMVYQAQSKNERTRCTNRSVHPTSLRLTAELKGQPRRALPSALSSVNSGALDANEERTNALHQSHLILTFALSPLPPHVFLLSTRSTPLSTSIAQLQRILCFVLAHLHPQSASTTPSMTQPSHPSSIPQPCCTPLPHSARLSPRHPSPFDLEDRGSASDSVKTRPRIPASGSTPPSSRSPTTTPPSQASAMTT